MVLSLCRYHGSCAQLLDELEGVSGWCISAVVQAHLLERLVVDKAGGIFWDLELALLYVLAELPGKTR